MGKQKDFFHIFSERLKSCEEPQLWISSVVQKSEIVFLFYPVDLCQRTQESG